MTGRRIVSHEIEQVGSRWIGNYGRTVHRQALDAGVVGVVVVIPRKRWG